ncbi:MAG TPA: LptA/OstA family protein [Acetobacteraceae bacterium]|nr:LptA/OstA family protein [Acetobacteraceae bacterium]
MRRWLPRGCDRAGGALVVLAALCFGAGQAAAQQIDLSHGGPIDITAKGGIEWLQQQQEVVATGDATAVRGNVTVTADRLIAWYRKKAGAASDGSEPAAPQGQAAHAAAQPPQSGLAGDEDTGGNEVYRVQAEGHVHIYTQTDQVWGDQATYDLDQAVLVVTGHNLRLTTPNDVLTARDDLEYWSQRHMAVARGDAVVITNDGRRLQGDVLVAYTTDTQPAPGAGTPQATPVADHPGAPANPQGDPLLSSGKLQKVDVFGHVLVRTVTDTVTGDRAVYVPDTGIARIAGDVRITRGQNQLNGSEAIVNMKTGISRLLAANDRRVQGLLVPNDQTNQSLASPGAASPAAAPGSGTRTRSAGRQSTAPGKQP